MKRCPTCGRTQKRTLPQNSRLHKLFTEMAANLADKSGEYHHMLWWKAMAKDRWLGYDEFKRPDGTTIYQLRSTADCDVEELTEFMDQVEAYANSRGVYLED